MKTKKVITSLILTITILVLNIVPAKADVFDWANPLVNLAEEVANLQNNAVNVVGDTLRNTVSGCLRGAGFIFNGAGLTLSTLADYISTYNNGELDGNSEQDIVNNAAEYLIGNTTINDSSVVYNNNSKSLLVHIADEIISNSGYKYVYSNRLIDHINDYSNGEYYNAIRQFLVNNPNKAVYLRGENYGYELYVGSKNTGYVLDGTFPNLNVYMCYSYNYNTWKVEPFTHYVYQNGEFIEDSTNNAVIRFGVPYDYTNARWYPADYNWFALNIYNVNKMYMTLNDMKADSVGISPYYVSDSWNKFVNSNNTTYTIDNNNSNNITYGDVNSWINNYYGDNGEYPKPTDINIYIDNNIPEPGGDNPGGEGGEGGQGGSSTITNNNSPVFNNNPNININLLPTVSGNSPGEGSGNGISNIFGFLSQIGEILGDFIKNIGEVLADVLEGIASVVTGLVESLPTVFGDFMGALIGWLPTELQALITLSITAMIIVGLIKLFRG